MVPQTGCLMMETTPFKPDDFRATPILGNLHLYACNANSSSTKLSIRGLKVQPNDYHSISNPGEIGTLPFVDGSALSTGMNWLDKPFMLLVSTITTMTEPTGGKPNVRSSLFLIVQHLGVGWGINVLCSKNFQLRYWLLEHLAWGGVGY